MVVARALVVLSLLGCRPVTHETRVTLLDECPCPCPPSDANVDAPIDAAPDAPPDAPPIDLDAAWTRTTITAGAATGLYRGADGVAKDSAGCWWTA